MIYSEEHLQAAGQLRRHVDLGWDAVAGLTQAKRTIASVIARTLTDPPRPGMDLMLPRRLLLYGPPGTGKTLLAAVTSHAIRNRKGEPAGFYAAKVSELVRSHFGETSRVISALYAVARENAPSVVFLDEFEAIAFRRGTDSGDSAEERRTLSTLLAELSGLDEKGRGGPYVLTIAATNRPWDLDRAALSRFVKRELIDLPGPSVRRQIIETHLCQAGFRIDHEDVDWPKLQEKTHCFSGRELEGLVQLVVDHMLEEVNAGLIDCVFTDPARLAGARLRDRMILMRDFLHFLEPSDSRPATQPQTGPEEQEQFRQFAEAPEALGIR